MRETRLSGSEGGGVETNRLSLPLSTRFSLSLILVSKREAPRRKAVASFESRIESLPRVSENGRRHGLPA
jgi:hypothetical protein